MIRVMILMNTHSMTRNQDCTYHDEWQTEMIDRWRKLISNSDQDYNDCDR